MGFGFGQLAAIGGGYLGVLEGLEQFFQSIGFGQYGVLSEEDDEVWGRACAWRGAWGGAVGGALS